MQNRVEPLYSSEQKIRHNVLGVLQDVGVEVAIATANWPTFNSAHEGYAILKEEVDELWQHVKTNQKRRDLSEMKKEAVQVAAMAVRFAAEVCSEERGRK